MKDKNIYPMSFEIKIYEFNLDKVIQKLNKIKKDYPNYNIILSAEKEFDVCEVDCPDCENSNAILVVRGRKKK